VTRRLEGKRALVTGGRRGIGLAVSRRLQTEGAELVVVHRVDGPPCPSDLDGLRQVAADVTDREAMARAVEVAAEGSRLDICVANSGLYAERELFLDAPTQVWDHVLRINLLGVLVTFQAAARHMTAHGEGGRLLATASIAGLRGEKECPAYSAGKAGVVALVQSLSVVLAPSAITVNAIAPGPVDTAMARQAIADVAASTGRTPEAVRERRQSRIPLRQLGDVDEVAALFAFLASDEAGHITGETIRIDGGEILI
jgi:NAD(P)-dependent dehydrogenase (short-subunit alcohol dehydrogenase family)